MILIIDTDRQSVSIGENEDCKRLSSLILGGGDINNALGALGKADADGAHLWIAVDALRKAAMPANNAAWATRFDAMIVYAESKGWIDATHALVRVHLSRE